MRESSFVAAEHHSARHNIAERMLLRLEQLLLHALEAEALGQRDGWLQQLDPRIKLLCLLLLILCGVATRSLWSLAALFGLAVLLALSARISLGRLCRQVWLGVLLFTGCIALPALFLVPGAPLLTVPWLNWHLTRNGLISALFLIGRAETSATLALLLVLTTPWPQLLKALRCLGAPVVLVAILGMTHRYVFVLLHSASQLFEARRSRMLAPLTRRQQRQLVVSTAGALLSRSIQLSSEVHLAMLARGYRGEVYLLDSFRTRRRDWLVLGATLLLAFTLYWMA